MCLPLSYNFTRPVVMIALAFASLEFLQPVESNFALTLHFQLYLLKNISTLLCLTMGSKRERITFTRN